MTLISHVMAIYRLVSSVITLLLLANCSPFTDAVRPMNFIFRQMPQEAPHEYKMGWKDGCESGLSAFGNDFYKSFYQYKQSADMIHNAYYYRGWFSAFQYCRGYAYAMLREGKLRSNRPEAPKERVLGEESGVLGSWGEPVFGRW